MKREIKFRGKRLDNGKWVYGVIIFINGGKTFILSNDGSVEVDPATVGQFIGLFDIQGKEIYEGDILKHKYHRISDWKGIVEYRPACFYITPNGDDFVLNEQRASQTQVIGNIHDNPELIKSKYKTPYEQE